MRLREAQIADSAFPDSVLLPSQGVEEDARAHNNRHEHYPASLAQQREPCTKLSEAPVAYTTWSVARALNLQHTESLLANCGSPTNIDHINEAPSRTCKGNATNFLPHNHHTNHTVCNNRNQRPPTVPQAPSSLPLNIAQTSDKSTCQTPNVLQERPVVGLFPEPSVQAVNFGARLGVNCSHDRSARKTTRIPIGGNDSHCANTTHHKTRTRNGKYWKAGMLSPQDSTQHYAMGADFVTDASNEDGKAVHDVAAAIHRNRLLRENDNGSLAGCLSTLPVHCVVAAGMVELESSTVLCDPEHRHQDDTCARNMSDVPASCSLNGSGFQRVQVGTHNGKEHRAVAFSSQKNLQRHTSLGQSHKTIVPVRQQVAVPATWTGVLEVCKKHRKLFQHLN